MSRFFRFDEVLSFRVKSEVPLLKLKTAEPHSPGRVP